MKLRRFLSFVAATTVILYVVGCKFSNGVDTQTLKKGNEHITQWSNLTQGRPQIARQFDNVGIDHNKELGNVYEKLVNFKNTQPRNVSDKKGLSDEEISFVINRYFSETNIRSVNNSRQNSDGLEHVPEFTFSPSAQSFIDQIKILIDPITDATPQSEVEGVIKQIEDIEKKAEPVLLPEEKAPFYAYTATSRASLAYWYDNVKHWDELRNPSTTSSARYISIWRRIGASVASDAAGAAVGAAMGAAIGAGIAGVGAPIGAIVGAVVVGGASSATGWVTGNLSIVVPITDLNERVRKGR